MGNDLSLTIIKRDGREEIFNLEKVANAVEKAIRAIHGKQPETNAANVTTSEVAEQVAVLVGSHIYAILEEKHTNKISVEDIQDQVEKALIEKNLPDIAKEYIIYRKHRNDVRYLNSSTNKVIADLVDVTKDTNDKRENANINAATVMGTMLKVGSSLMKEFNLRNMIRPEHSEKHRQGYIHIHDLDFSSLCVNCIYIPLSKLLNNGYSTGHGFLRQPQTIQSAAALTCIAIQSSQNSFFGGQAIPSLDYALAPYVAKSFARNFASVVELMYEDEIQKLSSASDFKKTLVRKIEEVYDRYGTLKADTNDSGYREALFLTGTLAGIDYKSPKLAKFYRKAWIRTVKDTNQAMESLVHNLCTMASRAGSQTPFSSVNLGLDTTEEGRTVTDALLNALDAGLGLGETAIFPITIFKMKKGITDKGSTNYDLFKKAIRVTAKRGYPNFASIDAPFNLEFYEPDVPETHAAYMGAVYHGMVTIKLIDDNGFWEDTFDMDISRVGELLMQYPWAIKGECKYIDFDDETRYFNVDDKHVKIYDSIRKDWVGIRKYMVFENKKKNWREVTFNGIEDPEFEVKMKLTNDHPLPVYHGDIGAPLDDTQFIRTMVEDVQIGDRIPKASCEGCDGIKFLEVTGIRVCKRKHVGYDFETISDRFDVGNICSHNCRTHVINNHFDPKHQITEGRGNLFWTTINLPMLALDATHEVPKNPDPIGTFFRKVDEIMDTVKDYSLDRFEIVARRRAKNYPFMIGQHEYCTSEQLTNPEDEIREVIKQGTISIGFIGLAETLIALTGKHHGESEEAQALGLKIIKHMKEKCDQYSNELNLNFSLMATPAEGCTGRLQRAIRNKYGVINGITDKQYLTNSFHVKNDYKISVWKKIDLEAPYHAMCLAGHISYVELDTDAAKNLSALEQIVNYMADSGMGYFALNHPLTRDPICGYVGPMRPDGTCPRCGRKEFEGVPASKLLSLSSYTPDPEYAITAPKIEDKDKTFNSI